MMVRPEWWRDAYDEIDDSDSNGPEPTHECYICGTEMRIESSPTNDWSWCTDCEKVTRFIRLE